MFFLGSMRYCRETVRKILHEQYLLKNTSKKHIAMAHQLHAHNLHNIDSMIMAVYTSTIWSSTECLSPVVTFIYTLSYTPSYNWWSIKIRFTFRVEFLSFHLPKKATNPNPDKLSRCTPLKNKWPGTQRI